jgi:hypothetical protein
VDSRVVDSRLFVWVDECGTHISMTRLRARAPRGERAFAGACPGIGARTPR